MTIPTPKPEKPTGWDYIIILIVFAVTGTSAAWVSRLLMPVTGLERGWNFPYVFTYILLITPVYQVLLLAVAFVFGKFNYFWHKQKLLYRWITGQKAKSASGKTGAEHSTKDLPQP